MRLTSFRASDVHEFLDFDITFNADLTFLTGINGSGKTTALNSIAALIAPDVAMLANLEYKSMSLSFILEEKEFTITSHKRGRHVEIILSHSPAILSISPYIPDVEQPVNQQISAEAAYYREFTSAYASHPVMEFILGLPTPMFLGLDRRSKTDDDYTRRYVSIRTQRSNRNVFGNSLAVSLRTAARLAEDNRKTALIAAGRVAEELQREILLGLLQVDVDADTMYSALTAPSSKDIAEIEALKRLLNTLPQVLKVTKEDVSTRVLPLFDRLQTFIAAIPAGKSANELLEKSPNPEVVNALIGWTGSQHQLRRIRNMQATVQKYNRRRGRFLDSSNKYLKLVNDFLQDSYKSIGFDESGNLGVNIQGLGGDPKDVALLSSGEAQIFVIISQLSFNKAAASDNVFIIDEPELSLHVDWQEIFVSSIQAANPEVQFILASHSPSIILDKVEKCVDVSPQKPRATAQ